METNAGHGGAVAGAGGQGVGGGGGCIFRSRRINRDSVRVAVSGHDELPSSH